MEWLLWIDIETTGLDIKSSSILQVACILTDMNALIRYELPEYTLYCSEDALHKMNEWCTTTHTHSGLLDKCRKSTITIKDVENKIILLLNEHVALTHKVYIAGNSVHFDKSFIKRDMSSLYARLHHRNMDVSSLNLYQKARGGKLPNVKTFKHTALSDINESIDEYIYYLKYNQ